MKDAYFICPVCSEDVPRNAKACPSCGACEKSGWNEDDDYLDGIDLPDEDYTTGRPLEERPRGSRKDVITQRFWMVVAAIVLIAMLWFTFRGMR